ncbi:riboflavin synthase alpha chain [Halopenitus malekzadehii]|uniref:Riboflavin synthase n=1 Tax=Halopenitus malekzadehii TaxID=1267564 RepID=A0A1H6JJ40_9EURY|nr:riboflavin synthase [Halopenitus malekzadehii]SEH59165.1 riboflavin synthase alpha chain [Halopenitus malekzadehii]
MFTGIVETAGEVVGVKETADGRRIAIAAPGLSELYHGQSISVSGVCLTVEAYGDDVRVADDGTATGPDRSTDAGAGDDVGVFEVFLASETVAKTYLGDLGVGDVVNVERAMLADGRFDGHLVQGHVDTVATVEAIEPVGEDWRFTFALPVDHARYVVQKGSVALDGISLTVADRREDAFDVAIIPTTYELTTLSEKEPGDPVHLEVDVIAKYVEGMIDGYV